MIVEEDTMADQGEYAEITPQEKPRNSNIWWIILVVVLVILVCCCIGALIFYFVIGDVILQIINNISYQLGIGTY